MVDDRKENQPYRGPEGRKGEDRRKGTDRRGEIRFELDRPDRRSGKDRRKGSSWDGALIR